jgi:hypothetical protein
MRHRPQQGAFVAAMLHSSTHPGQRILHNLFAYKPETASTNTIVDMTTCFFDSNIVVVDPLSLVAKANSINSVSTASTATSSSSVATDLSLSAEFEPSSLIKKSLKLTLVSIVTYMRNSPIQFLACI